MAMIFDWREVFRRPVAIAGHQIQVVCTARMSGCGSCSPSCCWWSPNAANTSGQDSTPKSRILAAAHSPSPTDAPP